MRRKAGRWLRLLRERRGLSQRDLAKKVGAEYYTFISQLEHGRGRIPPDRYLVWADALGVEPRELVLGLMPYYDPVTYNVIFGGEARLEASAPNVKRFRVKQLKETAFKGRQVKLRGFGKDGKHAVHLLPTDAQGEPKL